MEHSAFNKNRDPQNVKNFITQRIAPSLKASLAALMPHLSEYVIQNGCVWFSIFCCLGCEKRICAVSVKDGEFLSFLFLFQVDYEFGYETQTVTIILASEPDSF